jgi:hypothetical protein
MAELVRTYRRRLVVPLWIPGAAARAVRAGAILAGDHAETGRRTWEEFLADRLSEPAPAGQR